MKLYNGKNLQGAENKMVRLWSKQSGVKELGLSLDSLCPVKPTAGRKTLEGWMWV